MILSPLDDQRLRKVTITCTVQRWSDSGQGYVDVPTDITTTGYQVVVDGEDIGVVRHRQPHDREWVAELPDGTVVARWCRTRREAIRYLTNTVIEVQDVA